MQVGILTPAGERYLFAQRSWAELLQSSISAENKRPLHARLAQLAESFDKRTRLAHHLMEAGQGMRAVDLMLELRAQAALEASPLTLDVLEHAIVQADELGLPLSKRLQLSIALAEISSTLGDYERFQQHAPALLERLKRDSGLADWHELGDGKPAGERIREALGLAQARYEAAPEAERGLNFVEALQTLPRLCFAFITQGMIGNDPEMFRNLPSLVPFAPLSPAITVFDQMMQAMQNMYVGRVDAALELYRGVIRRINEPDRAGLDEVAYRETRMGVLQVTGTLEAVMGVPTAPERVRELQSLPGHRGNAWRFHRVTYLMLGKPLLEQWRPGVDQEWPLAAGAHIAALNGLGRYEEAEALGRQYYEDCLREAINVRILAPWVAQALLARSKAKEGVAIVDGCIEEAQARGLKGLGIGPFYEARARIALAMGDEATFQDYAKRYAAEYCRGKNALLIAKYERLIEAARIEGLSVSSAIERTETGPTHTTARDPLIRCVEQRLAESVSADERAHCALTVLMEMTGAETAHLFAIHGGRLRCLVSVPPA